jgi:hypothetical protein
MAECPRCGHSPTSHRNGHDCRAWDSVFNEICDCNERQLGMEVIYDLEDEPLEISAITKETLDILEAALIFRRMT